MNDSIQEGVSHANRGDRLRISIGMPVYNGERYIRAALDSLLHQTFKDFELTISDNASTDATEQICQEYAARDQRIRYVRQSMNIGAAANFRFVLLQSSAEYFMWAAADDIRSPDFLAENLSFLTHHLDYQASTCPVKFRGGNFDEIKMGDAPLDEDNPYDRIIKPFSTWHANGRFYSLFRRDSVTRWKHLSNLEFLGSDWTLVTHLASLGKFNRTKVGWVELGTKGMSATTNLFDLYRQRWFHWIVPFSTVIYDTINHMRGARPQQRFKISFKLWRLNYKAARAQFRIWRRARRNKGT